MKLPNYAIKESFFRTVPGPIQLNHGVFLLNGKCPLCRDYKRRMYLKEYPQKHMIYCHNCGYSRNYMSFLSENYPHEVDNLKAHQLDFLKSGAFFKQMQEKPKVVDSKLIFNALDFKLRSYLKSHSFPIVEKQSNEQKEKFRNHCIEYFKKRRVDESIYLGFYCFTKGPLKKYVGIPFYDEEGEKLIHIQGRRMFTPKTEEEEDLNPKYKFLKDSEAGIEIDNKPLWGQWLVDKTKTVIVCEGTLDAPAFDNGISTCGATISSTLIDKVKSEYPDRIWCIDSYWLDKTGRELTTELLELGEKCFIIPKGMSSKDSNDLLKEMKIDKIPLDFVLENTYSGKIGLIKLSLKDDYKMVSRKKASSQIKKLCLF